MVMNFLNKNTNSLKKKVNLTYHVRRINYMSFEVVGGGGRVTKAKGHTGV